VDNPRQVNQRRGYGIGKSSCPRIDWLGVIERQLWGCPGIALGRHKFATDDSVLRSDNVDLDAKLEN
jgi:hypothetical protein